MTELRRTMPFVVLFGAGLLVGAWLMVLPWLFEAFGVMSRHAAHPVAAAIGRVGLVTVVLSALSLLVLPALAIHGAIYETGLHDLAGREERHQRG